MVSTAESQNLSPALAANRIKRPPKLQLVEERLPLQSCNTKRNAVVIASGTGSCLLIQPPQERSQAQMIQEEREEHDDSQRRIQVSTRYRGHNLDQARQKRIQYKADHQLRWCTKQAP
jgi:hypothetical protein